MSSAYGLPGLAWVSQAAVQVERQGAAATRLFQCIRRHLPAGAALFVGRVEHRGCPVVGDHEDVRRAGVGAAAGKRVAQDVQGNAVAPPKYPVNTRRIASSSRTNPRWT